MPDEVTKGLLTDIGTEEYAPLSYKPNHSSNNLLNVETVFNSPYIML